MSIIKDIKDLKIQGAESIAIASAKLIRDLTRRRKNNLYRELTKARDTLIKTRVTEPCMFNTLNYLLRGINSYDDSEIRDVVAARTNEVLTHFKEADIKIAKFGARKIAKNMVIFTHCHSSTVVNILKEAKENKKEFEVHNTETRPLMQGRKTASELARLGIKVTHYVDAAARLALKKADLMLIGCDAITSEGKVINKVGSELISEAAEKLQVPIYVCTNAWKFDSGSVFGYELPIEERAKSEVWKNPPKKVKIDNHAFEKISPSLVSGIISELGIYPPRIFVEIVKENYSWIFGL